MPAYLIVNPNLELVSNELKKQLSEKGLVNTPDLLWLSAETKIGVEQAKQIRSFLSIKPYQLLIKGVVIEDATGSSEIVQNALLKTLEELPDDRLIWLGARHTQGFLPTLLSRVLITQLPNEQVAELTTEEVSEIERLQQMDLPERFQWVEKVKDRGEVVERLMIYYQTRMSTQPEVSQFAKELLAAEGWLRSNVNPRGVIEYLMLRLPKSDRD